DSAQFKGVDELGALEAKVRSDLEQYVALAERIGVYAEYRYTLGTDLILELEELCTDLVKEFRRPMVFAGQLVFQRENIFTRTLHRRPAFPSLPGRSSVATRVSVMPTRVGAGGAGAWAPGGRRPRGSGTPAAGGTGSSTPGA